MAKSKDIWCAADRATAWTDWMVSGKAAATGSSEDPLTKNLEIGRKLHIDGTPTIFLQDGTRIGGAISLAELEKALSERGSRAAHAKTAAAK